MEAPYYTQTGLARAAGLTKHAIAKAIDRGQISTVLTLDGVASLIPRREAERWLKDRRKPGRPQHESV